MRDRIARLIKAHERKDVILTTVSGVASTKKEMISYFDSSTCIDVITTKSFQVMPNSGNREPVICCLGDGNFGNSVGLRNPGMEVVLPELEELRRKGLSKLLNVSVSASSAEDFITLIRAFDHVADSIELNFSCPHAASGYGASIGSDICIATDYVRAIRKAYPEQKSALLIKLTPNVDNIGEIAASVMACGADGIVAINTVGPKLYIEPHSGKPILNNKLGGKGGASGRWVNERALECVREIRKAVGDDAIIIGMGGVSTSSDVAAMIDARREAGERSGDTSSRFIITENRMAYSEHTVTKLTVHTPEMLLIELDGELDCKAGQFAFLFVPGLGEKPFSVAHNMPLTFLIRKRGYFTSELFNLKTGDKVYTRSLYGSPLEMPQSENALFIAGGSGVAVLPSLCRMAEGRHTSISVLVGTSASSAVGVDGKALFEDYFREKAGEYKVVPDDGKVGRVLDYLPAALEGKKDLKVYLVGPEKFMAIAAEKLISLGLEKCDIFLSLERSTLCGIGLCGECVCGERLTYFPAI